MTTPPPDPNALYAYYSPNFSEMLRNFVDYDPYLLVRPGNNNRGRPSSSAALYPSRMTWLSPHTDNLIQALLRDEENLDDDLRSLNSLFESGANNEQIRNFRDAVGVGKDDWASVVDTRGFNVSNQTR